MYEPYYVVVFDLSDCTILFTLSHKLSDSRTDVFEIKIYVSIFCKTLKHFSFQEEFRKMLSKVYIGVCVKYRLLLWGF